MSDAHEFRSAPALTMQRHSQQLRQSSCCMYRCPVDSRCCHKQGHGQPAADAPLLLSSHLREPLARPHHIPLSCSITLESVRHLRVRPALAAAAALPACAAQCCAVMTCSAPPQPLRAMSAVASRVTTDSVACGRDLPADTLASTVCSTQWRPGERFALQGVYHRAAATAAAPAVAPSTAAPLPQRRRAP